MKNKKLLGLIGAIAGATTVVAPIVTLSSCGEQPEPGPQPIVVGDWALLSSLQGDINWQDISLQFKYKEAITQDILDSIDISKDFASDSDFKAANFTLTKKVNTTDNTILDVTMSMLPGIYPLNNWKAKFNLELTCGEDEPALFENFEYKYVEATDAIAMDTTKTYFMSQGGNTLVIPVTFKTAIAEADRSKLGLKLSLRGTFPISPTIKGTPSFKEWSADGKSAKAVIEFNSLSKAVSGPSYTFDVKFTFKNKGDSDAWQQTFIGTLYKITANISWSMDAAEQTGDITDNKIEFIVKCTQKVGEIYDGWISKCRFLPTFADGSDIKDTDVYATGCEVVAGQDYQLKVHIKLKDGTTLEDGDQALFDLEILYDTGKLEPASKVFQGFEYTYSAD